MYYVYIIQSKRDGKLYKGFTKDLKARIKEHNKGSVTFTKSRRPWKLVYYGAFVSRKDALKEELFLKSGKGRERLKYLSSDTIK